MDSRELLAQMCPHGIQIGMPFGGIPKLTALDVAAAVAFGRMRKSSAMLLLVKYCDDASMIHELWAHWFRTVMSQAARDGWKGKDGRLERLSLVTLNECLSANQCPDCHGTRSAVIDQKKIECPRCNGTGKQYDSERKLAADLGVEKKTYKNVWQSRVAWCRRELNSWEVEGAQRLAAALRDEAI